MNYGSISPPPPPFPLLPFSSTASTSQNKRYVLLENLSTSSTLLLFLLPYIFLLLSSYLDASASFSTTSYALPPPIPPPSSSPFTYSAVITSLPPLSTFLRADAVFTNLSSPLLAALSDRQISYSLLVSSPPSLAPLYATNPAPLPIVCNTPSHCSSPRLLDILFSAPNSAILSSSTVAVSIAYSPTNSSHPIPDLLTLLYEAASYSVQHESKSYDAFLSSTRFLLFLFTLVFAYVYSSQTFPNGSHVPFFSPSTLVPERRYVFILLCSLLLLINPVQIIVHHYGLYTPTLLFFSDLVTNAGIHGFLFSFLCIFSGLKHHTAASLQKRASQQRAIKLLRETQEHLQIDPCTQDLQLPTNALTLQHDPSSQFFADFIVPKLFFLLVALLSSLATLLLRYPIFLPPSLDPSKQKLLPTLYLVASAVQLTCLAIWLAKITHAAFKSGRILLNQSFFVTRYAQLTYRVCANILFLSLLVTTIPALFDLTVLFNKWQPSNPESRGGGSMSTLTYLPKPPLLQTLLRAVTAETSHVTFCATATSTPPGKLIFLTICCFIVGLIFFKPLKSRENESGDSRCVVNLARSTHTWRIFPLAIAKGSYTPVFCNELACWLLECSWQSYYSSSAYSKSNDAPGMMNLATLGLALFKEVIDSETDTLAYVCVKAGVDTQIVDGDNSNVIVVLFRGTVTTQNVKTDFDTAQVRLPEGGNPAPAPGDGIRVHKGFLESYMKIREGVMEAVGECETEYSKVGSGGGPKVYVTGHSLGGALAQLFSLDLACNHEVSVEQRMCVNNNTVVGWGGRVAKRARRNSFGGEGGKGVGKCQFPIACYSYGQPRVGNKEWAKYFGDRVPHCFRVVAEGDAFVTVPKYRYVHAGVEVLLDDAESGTVCVEPTSVERMFRFRKAYMSIQNHSLVKYRKCLELSFEREELEVVYKKQQRGQIPEWVYIERED